MKRRVFRVLGIFLIILTSWVSASQIVHADVDWAIIKQINLSGDGKSIFILVPGEILIYSISEDRVTNRIPIDKDFDRITHSEKTNTLILTSSSSKRLKIIQGEPIHKIDLSGLPFKGPADAAVTVAVFDDYQ